jgi:hypothetical protein
MTSKTQYPTLNPTTTPTSNPTSNPTFVPTTTPATSPANIGVSEIILVIYGIIHLLSILFGYKEYRATRDEFKKTNLFLGSVKQTMKLNSKYSRDSFDFKDSLDSRDHDDKVAIT